MPFSAASSGPSSPRRLHRRRWLLAVLAPAVLLGLLIGISEGLLAILDVAPSPTFFTRDLEAADGAALIPSSNPPVPGVSFHPARIPIDRGDALRVLCLGGSTTHGHPFEPPAAFADWLQARLPVLLPGRPVEVWNLGANGLDSDAIARLMDELWVLEPDLIVLYTGHNEFLEQNLAALLAPGRAALRTLLGRLRLGRLFLAPRPADVAGARVLFEADGDRLFDRPLLSAEQRERGWRRLEDRVSHLTRQAAAHAVPLAVVLPVSDLRDTPVQYSSFAPDTPAADRASFRREYATARAALAGEQGPEVLRAHLERLQALDDSVAALHYLRGRALLRSGEPARALNELRDAVDRDGYPIRASSEVHARLRRAAAGAPGTVVVDPWPALVAAADGLPGQDGWFVDYCHPDLEGHRVLAEAILRALADAELLAPLAQWRFDAEPSLALYRERMGLDAPAQARNLARRALAVLSQGMFTASSAEAVRGAEELTGLALRTDPDCALAHAARGFLDCLRGATEPALEHLQRAHSLNPECLAPFVRAFEEQPAVRQSFEAAGLQFHDGRPERAAGED